MNRRAIGCGLLAAVAFVAVGAFGVWRAFAPAGCPESLPYQPGAYVADGDPTGEPRLPGDDATLEAGGSASFGLASWPVWVRAGEQPRASGEPLPPRVVLDCGDGTFQAYRREAA